MKLRLSWLAAALTAASGFQVPIDAQAHDGSSIRHVLVLSVDGLHQADVAKWVHDHPDSALARLSARGVTYTEARTTTPSDSFPGLLSMLTGGTPKSTGVYYDDSYDRTLFAPGSNCTGTRGIEAVYDESIDHDSSKLFSGGIDPANLPMSLGADGQCRPVYPHDFVRVNTVFEVVRQAGLRTAWSDKHPAYDIVNGPSGHGVDDLYTPEINSDIANGGVVNGVDLAATKALCNGANSLPVAKVSDYTTCIPSIEAYDDVKVAAILHEIDGLSADGSATVGTPALFGMNFQAVSVGQKLPVGGYIDAVGTPSANLADAIAHTDQSIGRMLNELRARHLDASTMIIVSAKHGQSPIDRSTLAMEPGGRGNTTVQDPSGFIASADPTVDSPSSFTNPNSGSTLSTGGHLQTDDVGIVWLQDQSPTNVSAVVAQLRNNAGSMFATQLPPGTIFNTNITSGAALANIFGDPTSADSVAAARAPNVFIQPNGGVIYSGSSKKIAEHGGGTLDDRHVALIVSSPYSTTQTVRAPVSTTQIAPTILRALGLRPRALQAVRQEHTQMLPALGFSDADSED